LTAVPQKVPFTFQLLHVLRQLANLFGREIRPLSFGKQKEQVDLVCLRAPVVQHANAAALASTRQSPSNFSQSGATPDQIPGIRIVNQPLLKRSIVFI